MSKTRAHQTWDAVNKSGIATIQLMQVEIDFRKLAEAIRSPNLTLTGAELMLRETFECYSDKVRQ